MYTCRHPSIHWDHTLQSIGAAKSVSWDIHPSIGTILCAEHWCYLTVSWAIGHNPGQVATPTQDTRMAQSSQQAKLVLIFPTSEGWQAESTPPGFNSTTEQDLNSGPSDSKPTTLTIKPTPGVHMQTETRQQGTFLLTRGKHSHPPCGK